MFDFLLPIAICGMLFIGLPWLIFHYVTQWKKTGGLSLEDENLLDELHDLARRLDDRMHSIERIVAADSPTFKLPHSERTADQDQDDHVFDQISERRRRR